MSCPGPDIYISHLRVMRMDTSGGASVVFQKDLVAPTSSGGVNPEGEVVALPVISNADTGALVSWSLFWIGDSYSPPPIQFGMAITTGASASEMNAPSVPDQSSAVIPVLQLQDGSFVGTVGQSNGQQNMIAFDQSGAVRWSVPNEQPEIATEDGGVIGQSGTTYDQNGNVTGQIPMATQSWRGNMYRLGTVEQWMLLPNLFAESLWAQVGSGNSHGTASRPWFFRLSFENAFTFAPVSGPPNLTVDITSSAGTIKKAAISAAAKAYIRFPVTVHIFESDSGGNVAAHVIDSVPTCGLTNGPFWTNHTVGYLESMQNAQSALKVVINNAQDENAALSNPALIQAIGRGIGNIATHEIAHQFLALCCTMDADPADDPNARGAYNAGSCSGITDPSPWLGFWPNPKIELHWEQPAFDALSQCLAGGWAPGKICHQ